MPLFENPRARRAAQRAAAEAVALTKLLVDKGAFEEARAVLLPLAAAPPTRTTQKS